jgi:hypothetical protein
LIDSLSWANYWLSYAVEGNVCYVKEVVSEQIITAIKVCLQSKLPAVKMLAIIYELVEHGPRVVQELIK